MFLFLIVVFLSLESFFLRTGERQSRVRASVSACVCVSHLYTEKIQRKKKSTPPQPEVLIESHFKATHGSSRNTTIKTAAVTHTHTHTQTHTHTYRIWRTTIRAGKWKILLPDAEGNSTVTLCTSHIYFMVVLFIRLNQRPSLILKLISLIKMTRDVRARVRIYSLFYIYIYFKPDKKQINVQYLKWNIIKNNTIVMCSLWSRIKLRTPIINSITDKLLTVGSIGTKVAFI